MDEIDREELSVMEPIGKKRAQAMLDAGLSRTEVAARLGTTYNTIAGMIAHGTLKEKREKKMPLMSRQQHQGQVVQIQNYTHSLYLYSLGKSRKSAGSNHFLA